MSLLTSLLAPGNATYWAPRSTTPTDNRPLWLSDRTIDLRVSPDPGDRNVCLEPSLAWEGNGTQEPNVVYANGVYNMLYTGNFTTNAGIGLATAPSLAGPWTKVGTAPVLGQGNGGHAGSAMHSNLYVEGGTAYLYFVDNSATLLRLATASLADLTTWTTSATTWALPAGATLWGNVCIFKEADNSYTMMFEAFRSAWLIGVGTLGSSLTGALTVQTSISTDLKVGSAGSTSGPILYKEGSTYVLYYHAGVYGSLPTDIYRATSTDKVSWVIDNNGQPIIARAHPVEVDQVADLFPIQDADGMWWGFWEGFDNPGLATSILSAPMFPALRRYDADSDTYVRVGDDATGSRASRDPGKPQVSFLTANASTSSTSFADVGLTVDFIPTSTRALITLASVTSGTAASTPVYFAVNCPNTSVTKTLGNTPGTTSGAQYPHTGMALFTGLTPGVVYQFKAQWKVTANTANCRASSFPENEVMQLKAEDAGQPYGPNNA